MVLRVKRSNDHFPVECRGFNLQGNRSGLQHHSWSASWRARRCGRLKGNIMLKPATFNLTGKVDGNMSEMTSFLRRGDAI